MRAAARAALKPLALLSVLAGVLLAVRQWGVDPREVVALAGRHGAAAFVLAGGIACALAVPRQIVALAGGAAFGFWPGAVLALSAELIGCIVDFYWARWLGRRAATRFLARREGGRLHRLDRFLAARAFSATLTIRLLPFGNNVVLNLLAGVSAVAAVPFFLGSLLGYVPQTVVFALAGAGAGVSNGQQLALALVLLGFSIALGFWLLRRRAALAAGVSEAS